jgi:uncharacterized protein (TIGR02246 family)
MKKTYLVVAIVCSSLVGVTAANAEATQPSSSQSRQSIESPQQAAIEKVLKSYERSLNASDVDGVAHLYTDDAVVMPPNASDAVGIEAVRATYTGIFQAIDLHLTFDVAEVEVVSRDWAFLRSTSSGTITILANGAQIPSRNHELFMLHKVQGHWKLARYSFSSTLPSA